MANNTNITWVRLSTPFGEVVLPKTGGGISSDVINDSFNRQVVSGGWGSLNSDFSWTVLSGTANDFSVGIDIDNLADGSRGRIVSPTHTADWIGLTNLSVANCDVTGRIAVDVTPTGSNIGFGPMLRYVDGNNHYRFKILFGVSGAVFIAIDKLVGGSLTVLQAPASVISSYTPTTDVKYHARISANKLYLSAWLASASEPAWQINGLSDYGISSAGTVALRFDLTGLTNSPKISVDDLAIQVFQAGGIKAASFSKTGGASTASASAGGRNTQYSKTNGGVLIGIGGGARLGSISRTGGGTTTTTSGGARVIIFSKTGGSQTTTFGAGSTKIQQVILTWVQFSLPAAITSFSKTGGGTSTTVAGIIHLHVGGGKVVGISGASRLVTASKTGGAQTATIVGGARPPVGKQFGGTVSAVGGGAQAHTQFGPWSESEQITISAAMGAGAIAPLSAGGGHVTLIQKTGGGITEAKAGFIHTGGAISQFVGGGTRVIVYQVTGGGISNAYGGIRTIPHGIGGLTRVFGGASRTTLAVKSGGASSTLTASFSRLSTTAKTGGASTTGITGGTSLIFAINTGGASSQFTSGANRLSIYSRSSGAITGIVGGGSLVSGTFYVVTGGGITVGFSGASRNSSITKSLGAASSGVGGASRLVRNIKSSGGISSSIAGASRLTILPRIGGARFNGFASATRTTLHIRNGGSILNSFAGGQNVFVRYAIVSGGGISVFRGGGIKLIATVFGGSSTPLTAGGHVNVAFTIDFTIPHAHVLMRAQLKKPKLMRTKMSI